MSPSTRATSAKIRGRPDLISVIIPIRNTEGSLPQQLEALSTQTYEREWEVIVADNGSDDRSVEIARAWSDRLPSLTVIEAPGGGANRARNEGARRASGDLLAFCDGDDVVDAGWLTAIAEAAPAGDLIAGSLDYENLNDPQSTPWLPSVTGWHGSPESYGFLPIAASANLGVWADVWQAVGGFDEAFMVSQDVDFSWRVQLAGFRLTFTPKAVVHYRHRGQLKAWARRFARRGQSEAQLFRKFRSEGMPRSDTKIAVKTLLSLVYRLPHAIVSPSWRIIWVVRGAPALGRLTGSIRWRVFYL